MLNKIIEKKKELLETVSQIKKLQNKRRLLDSCIRTYEKRLKEKMTKNGLI